MPDTWVVGLGAFWGQGGATPMRSVLLAPFTVEQTEASSVQGDYQSHAAGRWQNRDRDLDVSGSKPILLTSVHPDEE